jgi:hypothetical protein
MGAFPRETAFLSAFSQVPDGWVADPKGLPYKNASDKRWTKRSKSTVRLCVTSRQAIMSQATRNTE